MLFFNAIIEIFSEFCYNDCPHFSGKNNDKEKRIMCTVDFAFQNFMLDNIRKNLSPETMRYYRENLTRFIHWLNDKSVKRTSKITQAVIDEYLLFLVQSVPNKTSVNTYLRAIRRFINYLTAEHLIKPVAVELVKDAKKIKPTFSNVDVVNILGTVDTNDDTSVMMLLLLSVGIRSRSLCELRVQDIDFDDGYINVQRTKNGEPLRLPISADVTYILKEYVVRNGKRNYLFETVRGNKFNRDSLAKRINKRLRKLGVQEHKKGVHIFRHTFGKIMSMNSCPTTVLQKWFGHSDIRVTQRYVDLYGNELKSTMNMLPTRDLRYSNNL